MKFLCLTLWQGEVYTDNNANTNTNDNARQTKHDKPNEPKVLNSFKVFNISFDGFLKLHEHFLFQYPEPLTAFNRE